MLTTLTVLELDLWTRLDHHHPSTSSFLKDPLKQCASPAPPRSVSGGKLRHWSSDPDPSLCVTLVGFPDALGAVGTQERTPRPLQRTVMGWRGGIWLLQGSPDHKTRCLPEASRAIPVTLAERLRAPNPRLASGSAVGHLFRVKVGRGEQ